jgi:hypothetical protein
MMSGGDWERWTMAVSLMVLVRAKGRGRLMVLVLVLVLSGSFIVKSFIVMTATFDNEIYDQCNKKDTVQRICLTRFLGVC